MAKELKCTKAMFTKADNKDIDYDNRLLDYRVYSAEDIHKNNINVGGVAFRCLNGCRAKLHYRKVGEQPHFVLFKDSEHAKNCTNIAYKSKNITIEKTISKIDYIAENGRKEIKKSEITSFMKNTLNRELDVIRLHSENSTALPKRVSKRKDEFNIGDLDNAECISKMKGLNGVYSNYYSYILEVEKPKRKSKHLIIRVRNKKKRILNNIYIKVCLKSYEDIIKLYDRLDKELEKGNIFVCCVTNHIEISKKLLGFNIVYNVEKEQGIEFNGVSIESLIGK